MTTAKPPIVATTRNAFGLVFRHAEIFAWLSLALLIVHVVLAEAFEAVSGVSFEQAPEVDTEQQATFFATMGVFGLLYYLVVFPITTLAAYYVCSEIFAGRKPLFNDYKNCLRANWGISIRLPILVCLRVIAYAMIPIVFVGMINIASHLTGVTNDVSETTTLFLTALKSIGVIAFFALLAYLLMRYALAHFFAYEPDEYHARRAIKHSVKTIKGYKRRLLIGYLLYGILLTLMTVIPIFILTFIWAIATGATEGAAPPAAIELVGNFISQFFAFGIWFIGLTYYQHIRQTTPELGEE